MERVDVVELENAQSNTWLSRPWSKWLALDTALQRDYGPPHQPGVYRIGDAYVSDSLLYIGESNDLRSRLFQLRKGQRNREWFLGK